MNMKRWLSLLLTGAMMLGLLSGCISGEQPPNSQTDSDALTCFTWGGFESFLELAHQTYPDLKLEFAGYAGANRTGYSWVQMRGDDIPDIFITSQILDEDLVKERLVDLSHYDFVNGFSTSLLDQVAIDGGVYLLPVNQAMYGIFYNKTLMEEHNWQVPNNFAELEALCAEIEAAGLIPGMVGTNLTGGPFSTVLNLAKTSWFTTPEGINWERDFLAGNATAAGRWEDTMEYIQRYIDIGMLHTDPEDRHNANLILDYLGNRKAVFCIAIMTVNITAFPDTGDKIGMMPFISEDGSKNVYMYSPSSYIGISSRLTQPGNEKKLEQAIQLLSLLYSPEGQTTFITEETPCLMSVLDRSSLPEDSLIYDAQKAMQDGRAFPMTYARWENVLSDMGQAYKEWFRGENGMNGTKCIARMDELQSSYLNSTEELYFCESTANFTLEQTAQLVGKALGSAVGADAALIPVGRLFDNGTGLREGITGKLYAEKINAEIANTIMSAYDGEYALMNMTGAQVQELVSTGFYREGSEQPYPYVLVTRDGVELEDSKTYQVAFLPSSYTEETGQIYNVQVEKGSVRTFLRNWLTEQKTVSPDGNPWE